MIRLARQLGIADALEIIDLGSGFFSKMPESLRASFPMHVPSYQEYGAAVGEVFASEFANGGPQLVLEPGKPIVADAMLFATRVVEIKHIESRTYIQVAGSVYDIRPTKAERNLPLTRYARDSLTQCATDVHADIVGYTCMEDDVLHRDYRGQVARGDWFVFENCGAYTNVLKPPFIGGAAPIVVLDQGTARLARRRETLDDLLRAYLLNGS
jgi:diaminopimelate decarboxylase